MTNKRFFEVLDNMNQEDTANGTQLVEVSSNFISAKSIKQGGKIGMGVPYQSVMDVFTNSKIPVLILIDRREYYKRMIK